MAIARLDLASVDFKRFRPGAVGLHLRRVESILVKSIILWSRARIVCKVGHMLICCTGAGTHNFQIASERLQYRLKGHVLGHIRPPSTLQNFQYSIETIFAF